MKRNRKKFFQLKKLLNMLVIAQFAGVAQAGERESLEQLRATTTNLINALVQEGVLPKDKADALLKKASNDAAELASSSDKNDDANDTEGKTEHKSVRVQLVPEFVKVQMREDIKKEVMTELNYKAGERLGMPAWLDSIAWEGDLRMRYESDQFGKNNPPERFFNTDPLRNSSISNTTVDRERWRIRARLGADIKVNDWLSGGIRLITGSDLDPVSPNQTESMGTGKYTFSLDRAFLKAKVNNWLSVSGGRIANPFFHTDLVWDPDLAFDGIAANFSPKINNKLSMFGTLGAFPIEEVNTSTTNRAPDKWMYAAQAGVDWKFMEKTSAKLGVALYDYSDVQGRSNGNVVNSTLYDATVPVFRKKGNNTFNINEGNGGDAKFALASEFTELNITGQVDIAQFNPVHVILTGDYVRNIGFDQAEILARTGHLYAKENEGYQARLAVGMPTTYKAKDWQVWLAYKRLEADAVVDGFTDDDFALGGTDSRGWVLGASYGVDKNAWITGRWFSSESISGLSNNQLPLSIDVLMLELNAKF